MKEKTNYLSYEQMKQNSFMSNEHSSAKKRPWFMVVNKDAEEKSWIY